jgi:hypothetical protein
MDPGPNQSRSRTWDVVVGIFMLAVGIPIQLIVAGLGNLALYGLFALCGTELPQRWAVPLLICTWLVVNAAAFVDWYWFGVAGKVLSREDVFYLTPRALSRILTGSESPPRTRAE